MANKVFQLTRNTTQNAPSGTEVPVVFDTADFDTDSGFSGGHYVVPVGGAGSWLLFGEVSIDKFSSSSQTRRLLYFRINGVEIDGALSTLSNAEPSAAQTGLVISAAAYLDEGDIIDLVVRQDAAGSAAIIRPPVRMSGFSADTGGTVGEFQLARTGTQPLPSGQSTAIVFDTEIVDVKNGWDAAHKTRYAVGSNGGGFYFLYASVDIDAADDAATSRRFLAFRVNGTTFRGRLAISSIFTPTGVRSQLCTYAVVPLVPGDYVEVIAKQDSGTTAHLVGPSRFAGFQLPTS